MPPAARSGSASSSTGGPTVELGGLFVAPGWAQAAPFAEQLDLDRSPMGAILVDAFGRASRPGVYAAGDIAQTPGMPMPMASVLAAAAAGQLAAAACDRELAAADNGLSLPGGECGRSRL